MSSETGLYRLVYVSRPALTGDEQQMEREVGRILDASRRNNPRAGVTGALLFSADCFAQTLEGGSAAVREVFERIQCDPRHRHSVVLETGPVDRRDFADWSMAYAGRVEDERARFDKLTGSDVSAEGSAGAGQVLTLLRGIVLRAAPALV